MVDDRFGKVIDQQVYDMKYHHNVAKYQPDVVVNESCTSSFSNNVDSPVINRDRKNVHNVNSKHGNMNDSFTPSVTITSNYSNNNHTNNNQDDNFNNRNRFNSVVHVVNNRKDKVVDNMNQTYIRDSTNQNIEVENNKVAINKGMKKIKKQKTKP